MKKIIASIFTLSLQTILFVGLVACTERNTQSPRCPNMPDRAAQMKTLQELEGVVFLHANLKDDNHWYLTADSRVWRNLMQQNSTTMEKSLFCLSLIEGQQCCRKITIQDGVGVTLYTYAGPK